MKKTPYELSKRKKKKKKHKEKQKLMRVNENSAFVTLESKSSVCIPGIDKPANIFVSDIGREPDPDPDPDPDEFCFVLALLPDKPEEIKKNRDNRENREKSGKIRKREIKRKGQEV